MIQSSSSIVAAISGSSSSSVTSVAGSSSSFAVAVDISIGSSSSSTAAAGIIDEVISLPVGRTAKDILGLTDQRGDYLQGNVDPRIDPTGRGPDEFAANKVEYPGGEPFTPFWDSSR